MVCVLETAVRILIRDNQATHIMSMKARSIGAIWNQNQLSPRKMSVPLRQVRADSERYHTKRPSAVLATPIRPTLGKSVLPMSRGYPPAVELKKAFYARSSCYRGQSQLRRKPECSYNTLITMALLTSEEETLPVRKIYKYLELVSHVAQLKWVGLLPRPRIGGAKYNT